MSVLVPPETKYGIEMWRWDHTEAESNPFDSSVKGMRPVHHQDYPAMMYRATQKNPWKFEQEIAGSEAARSNLESRGFVYGGPKAAADAFDAQQQEFAVLAAARNFEDRNMSDGAKAERDAAEQASATHLPVIATTPIAPRAKGKTTDA